MKYINSEFHCNSFEERKRDACFTFQLFRCVFGEIVCFHLPGSLSLFRLMLFHISHDLNEHQIKQNKKHRHLTDLNVTDAMENIRMIGSNFLV